MERTVGRKELTPKANQALRLLEECSMASLDEHLNHGDKKAPLLKKGFAKFVSSVAHELPSYLEDKREDFRIVIHTSASSSGLKTSMTPETNKISYYFVPKDFSSYAPTKYYYPVHHHPSSPDFQGFNALSGGYARLRIKDMEFGQFLDTVNLIKDYLKEKSERQPTLEEVKFNQDLEKFREAENEMIVRRVEELMEKTLRYLQALEDQFGNRLVGDAIPYDRRYYNDSEGLHFYLIRSQRKIVAAFKKRSLRSFGKEIPDLANVRNLSIREIYALLTSPRSLETPK